MANAWSEPLERAENERHLFAGFRAVRERYDIAPGGIVIGAEGVKRWHAPIAHPELPQMVAKLETADDRAMLAFYETYGELGFMDETTDPTQQVYTWPDGRQTTGGDLLAWVRAHARTVRVCFELTDAIQRQHTPTLERLTTSKAWDSAKRGEIVRASAADRLQVPVLHYWLEKHRDDIRPDFDHIRRKRPPLLIQARLLRAALINPNIATIHRFLKVQPDGVEQSFFSFGGQIEVVYWHLANLSDGGIVGRCKRPGCGAFFIQRHKSQEYCAPRYAQRESPCALWVRQRRLGQPKTKTKTKQRKKTK